MRRYFYSLAGLAWSTTGLAQPSQPFPIHVPAPHGEVALTSEQEQTDFNTTRYAPVRRAGDFVFVSGDIAGPYTLFEYDNGAGFRAQVERTFKTLERRLRAEGATFEDVVWMHSYHVFNGPGFSGGKLEQLNIFMDVKNEYMPKPYPAWTAVGVQELFSSRGVVEVELMAYAPRQGSRK